MLDFYYNKCSCGLLSQFMVSIGFGSFGLSELRRTMTSNSVEVGKKIQFVDRKTRSMSNIALLTC